MQKQSAVADMMDGAIAGAVATWVMGKVTTVLYEHENKSARRREDDARNGKTAYGVAAGKAAGLFGNELSDEERKRYGKAIHWAIGIGAGSVYGLPRSRNELTSLSGGLLFGTAFWLIMDETVTPVLGLTKGPRAFPWQTHARGLAGHLAFGAAARTTLAAMQPVA